MCDTVQTATDLVARLKLNLVARDLKRVFFYQTIFSYAVALCHLAYFLRTQHSKE